MTSQIDAAPGQADARLSRNATLAMLIVAFALAAILWNTNRDLFLALMVSEQGLVENVNFAVTLGAAILAALIALRARTREQTLLRIFSVLGAVFLTFWAGEEISWGQHWFGWSTPEGYADLNMQGETNLHNLFQGTEELPKLGLTIGVYLGGIFWPIYASLRRRPPLLKGAIGWIWPDARLWHAAAGALFVRLAERAFTIEGIRTPETPPFFYFLREYQELLMALYVLVYFISVYRRVRAPAA